MPMQNQARTQASSPTWATSLKVPGELRTRLQNLAASRHRTPHSIMLEALESFVSREEQRESLRQEARAAHEEYVLTGLHVTAKEADDWLAQLEAGNDAEPPKCHI